MATPRTVLIDTNVFYKHTYHFASPTLEKFVDLAKTEPITVLLPDVLRREIERHIKEWAKSATGALKKLSKEHPIIQRWPVWPGFSAVKGAAADIETATMADWKAFLANFKVETIGNGNVDLNEVMNWYDRKEPPFAEGKKEKEFPDAFIISAIAAYAKSKKCEIAVVSSDGDMRKACGRYSSLHHYPDLALLTDELLEEFTKTKTPAIRSAVAANPALVIAAIGDHFLDLGFVPEEDYDGDVSDVEVHAVQLFNLRIISLSKGACTVALDAEIEFSAHVEYDDPDSMVIDSSEDFSMALHRRAGSVADTVQVAVAVSLEFDDDWKTMISVDALRLGEDLIEIRGRPPIADDIEEE